MRLGTPELILIVLAILLLFGAKRLPDLSRSLGRSLRIFKSETKAMVDEQPPSSSSEPVQPRQITSASGEVTEVRPVNESEHTER
ncbi:MAG TPA: Sec-independent protein translocase subunit TatA [Actinomycetes bacterium]|nr:Sec-independent protein translocase subunit TatA [Actinomycetes bacterium]